MNAPRLPRRYAESLQGARARGDKFGSTDVLSQEQDSNFASGSGSGLNSLSNTSHSHSKAEKIKKISLHLKKKPSRLPPPPPVLPGQSGSTPLHFAASNGHAPIVRILLACGALTGKEDKYGYTPKMLAVCNGHEEVVKVIEAWEGLVEGEREGLRAGNIKVEKPEEVVEEKHEGGLRKSLEGIFGGKRRNLAKTSGTGKRGPLFAQPLAEGASEGSALSLAPSEDGNEHEYPDPALDEPDDHQESPISPSPSTSTGIGANAVLAWEAKKLETQDGMGSRRPSMPSIFERRHLGFRRSSLRKGSAQKEEPVVDQPDPNPSVLQAQGLGTSRKSFSSDVSGEYFPGPNFRGRLLSRTSEFSDHPPSSTASSIHSAARHMTKSALLNLFRKNSTDGGGPRSLSPSPTRGGSGQVPLLPEEIDESVERIKRVSLDASRPGSSSYRKPSDETETDEYVPQRGKGRQRSGSQVTFSDSVHELTSSGRSSSMGYPPRSAPPTMTAFQLNGRDTEDEGHQTETPEGVRSRSHSNASLRSEGSSRLEIKPLSRSGSEVIVPSPLGNEWTKMEGDKVVQHPSPRSILRKRGTSSPPPKNSILRSLPGTPLSKGKRRSATMPEAIPFDARRDYQTEDDDDAQEQAIEDDRHEAQGSNQESPEHDKHQSEKQDQVGESIWDRAAARRNKKSKSRAESFGSVSPVAPIPASPSSSAGHEVIHRRTNSADGPPPSRLYSIRFPGTRPRNRSISSVSTTTSGMGHSTSTFDSNFTPFTPVSQNTVYDQSGSSNGHGDPDGASLHAKKGFARRLSRRKEKNPPLLYTVPLPSSEKRPDLPREPSHAEQAADLVRQTEQNILQTVSGTGSSLSLAEQLAAYGDSLLLQEQLTTGLKDPARSSIGSEANHGSTDGDQVSRSYVKSDRPVIRKTDSSDSNATLRTQSSRPSHVQRRRVTAPSSMHGPSPKQSSDDSSAKLERSIRKSRLATNSENATLRKSTVSEIIRRHTNSVSYCLASIPGDNATSTDSIYIASAPSSSIPAINRIYEERANAYRKKGMALAKKAPIYGSPSKSPKTPVDINDHWLTAGIRRDRAPSGGSSPGDLETTRPAISLPMPVAHNRISDGNIRTVSSKRRSASNPQNNPSPYDSKPRLNPVTAAVIDVRNHTRYPAMHGPRAAPRSGQSSAQSSDVEVSSGGTKSRRPSTQKLGKIDMVGLETEPRSRSTSGGSNGITPTSASMSTPVASNATSPHSMRARWGELNFKSATRNLIGKHRT